MATFTRNPAEPTPNPATKAWAEMLRAAIQSIPKDERATVFAQLRDLLEQDKAPKRGRDLLNNVYELFKREPEAQRSAPEVVAALADKGTTVDVAPVRYALNYLHGRRVLQRVGYGKYRLEDGSLVEGLP